MQINRVGSSVYGGGVNEYGSFVGLLTETLGAGSWIHGQLVASKDDVH